MRLFWLMLGLLSALSTLVSAQDEYSYSYIPKKVYKNQLFPVTIIDSSKNEKIPLFEFDISSKIQALFKKPLIVHNGNDSFYTFYFKASDSDIQIPRLFIVSDGSKISLDPRNISIMALKSPKDFSQVFATDMQIKNYQISNYDSKNHMATLQIEAYEANLEDIFLENVTESGIEDLKRDNAKVKADFYAILPREQKKLSFKYYNTTKRRFIDLKIPIELSDSSVTAQSDLNPKVDAFDKLKRYGLIFFMVFFIIMFSWKKDFLYLALAAVSLITLLTFYIPHEKICIKQGAPLYILPTQSSTIGTRIDSDMRTMLLDERGEYKKVEYQKGIIGWIKNEDLCDN